MKIKYFLPLLLASAALYSCSSRDNREKDSRGRRQVLSDKKSAVIAIPSPVPESAPFVMRLNGSKLTLYELAEGNEYELRTVNINPEYYPSEDIKELTAGIPAYSKEEGFLRLENFTN